MRQACVYCVSCVFIVCHSHFVAEMQQPGLLSYHIFSLILLSQLKSARPENRIPKDLGPFVGKRGGVTLRAWAQQPTAVTAVREHSDPGRHP